MRDRFRALVLAALAMGCTLESQETDAPCIDLFPSECSLRSDCDEVAGRPLGRSSAGAPCVETLGDPVARGCAGAGADCVDGEILAAPPEDPDECWWFADSCVPDGWMPCADTEVPPPC